MRIAVLGLGAMGRRFAENLIADGHVVTVWNRSPATVADLVESGAIAASSIRAAVADAEVVLSMVRDDEAARRVWLDASDGALSALPEAAVAIESSTITPGCARHLSAAFALAERRFVEAPVLGSRPQAEARGLVHLVSGRDEDVTHAQPVLERLGGKQLLLGEPGQAAIMKLVVNTLFAGQVALGGELYRILSRAGADMERAVAMLSQLPVTSPALSLALSAMQAENFAPQFPVALVAKDLAYTQALAEESGAPGSVVNAVAELFTAAAMTDIAGDNLTAIVRFDSEAQASRPVAAAV